MWFEFLKTPITYKQYCWNPEQHSLWNWREGKKENFISSDLIRKIHKIQCNVFSLHTFSDEYH